MGKALAYCAWIVVLVSAAFLIPSVLAFVGSGVAGFIAVVPQLILLGIGYGAYLGVFLVVTLTISVLAPSSRTALAAALAVWLSACVLLPRAIADVAERFHPTPRLADFWKVVDTDLAQGIDGHSPTSERTQAFKKKLLREYGVQRVEDLPVDFSGMAMLASEEYGNQVFDKRWGELWEQFEKQDALRAAFAFATPIEAIRGLSAALSGTDFAQHRAFALSVEAYRREMNRYLNEDLAYHGAGRGRAFRRDRAFWESTPQFVYKAPSLAEILAAQASNIAVLLGWLTASSLFCWWRVGRIHV